jgi:hypothetical protein
VTNPGGEPGHRKVVMARLTWTQILFAIALGVAFACLERHAKAVGFESPAQSCSTKRHDS